MQGRIPIALTTACLALLAACSDEGGKLDAAPADAAVDGAAVDTYTPAGDGALKPCTTPGSSCVTDDPCVVEAACGQDKLCRPKTYKDCADKLSCTTDSCNAQGQCESKPAAGSCVLQVKDSTGKVELKCFKQDDPNPQNACEICDPSTSATTWSNATGVSCDDGQDCTRDDTCTKGKCVGTDYSASCPAGGICLQAQCDGKGGCKQPKVLAGYCWIDNNCWPDGVPSKDGCGSCDTKTSQTSWTSPTALCKISQPWGGVQCYKKGDKHPAGCAACDPAASASSWTITSGCLINDQCLTAGAKDGSGCSTCDPSKSKTAWTPKSGVCQIGPSCYAKGAVHTGYCAVCDPALSATAWTVVGNRCLINDQCYKEDETDPTGCQICAPATSTTSWSPTPSTCNIGPSCYKKGDMHPAGCAECDPAKSATSWSVTGSGCFIMDKCWTSGAKGPGPCEECMPAKSQVAWSPVANTCLIAGTCYGDKTTGTNGCLQCSSATNQYDWTPVTGAKTTSYGFESGKATGWTLTNTHATVGWVVHNKRAKSGSYALYYGDPATNSYNTLKTPTSGTATLPAISLTAGKQAAIVFNYWADVMAKATTLTVHVDGGAVWSQPLSIMQQWQQVTINLNAYAGKTVTIKLELQAPYSNVGEGLHVDDIVIYHGC